jgi:uncharacterized membrane protein YphA (DoxX/SURF4 family)
MTKQTMKTPEEQIQLKWVVRIIFSALCVQLLICFRLWIPCLRAFPMIPAFKWLPILWGNIPDIILYIVMLIACIALIIRPFLRKALLCFVCAYLLLLIEDIDRLQPWLYLYLLMVSSLLLCSRNKTVSTLFLCRLILCSVYFWSGLQKLNIQYAENVFPWLVDFTGGKTYLQLHTTYAYLCAFLECSMGIMLWIKRLRKFACYSVFAMHLFILFTLGPLVHNWNIVIWPWNIAFGLLVYLLFFRSKPVVINLSKITMPAKIHIVSIALLASIMPCLGLIDKWDHFLSYGFYSGMPAEPEFYLPASERSLLPASSIHSQYLSDTKKTCYVQIDIWAMDEMNVPLYPEERIYFEVAKKLSTTIMHDEKTTGLSVTSKTRFSDEDKLTYYTFEQIEAME